MSGKRARRGEQKTSLFMYLDVLICTLGALIVLLALLAQNDIRRATAEVEHTTPEVKPAKPALSPEELKRLKENEEDLLWRADQLRELRDGYAQDLINKRLELSHFEDHIRRLEDEMKALATAAQELKNAGLSKLADEDAARQQLAEMDAEIADKKRELEDAKLKLAKRKPAYAIIPYDGPHGTSRRPMYIECLEDKIVIQPEGIVLSPKDFDGPLGPGNPLDAALRAIREHMQRKGLKGEPYPLVIVRPNGSVAFGACRSAMKHWESEFGYELVDADMQLTFPPAEPALAETLERAVSDARERQAMLAAAMPKRFNSDARQASFRASDQEGFGDGSELAGNGGQGGSGQSGGGQPGGGTGTGQGAAGSPNGSRGLPSIAGGGSGNGFGQRGATGAGGSGMSGSTGSLEGRYAANSGGMGTNSGAQGNSSSQGTGNANSAGGSSGSGQSGNQNASSAGGSGQSARGGSPGGTAAQGSTQGSSRGSGSQGSGSPGGSSMTSGGSPSSSGSASAGSPPSASGDSPKGTSSSPSRSADGSASGSPSLVMNQQSSKNSKVKKAIRSHGDNWGLPIYNDHATGIKRPIRVQCYPDKLVLLPDSGDSRVPLVVPIEDNETPNLEVLIESVWKHMDRWGIAVAGGFWKPMLSVEVKEGGDASFAQLQTQLHGSGIEVQRKTR